MSKFYKVPVNKIKEFSRKLLSYLSTSKPESAIDLADSKPESAIDLADSKPESAIDLADSKPESAIDLADSKPESAIDLETKLFDATCEAVKEAVSSVKEGISFPQD